MGTLALCDGLEPWGEVQVDAADDHEVRAARGRCAGGVLRRLAPDARPPPLAQAGVLILLSGDATSGAVAAQQDGERHPLRPGSWDPTGRGACRAKCVPLLCAHPPRRALSPQLESHARRQRRRPRAAPGQPLACRAPA